MSMNRLLRSEVVVALAWLAERKSAIENSEFSQVGKLISEISVFIGREEPISRGTFRRLCKDAKIKLPTRSKPQPPQPVEITNLSLDEQFKMIWGKLADIEKLLKSKLFA